MRQGEASMTARHVAAYRQSFPSGSASTTCPSSDNALVGDSFSV